VSFLRDIQPVLDRHCTGCHSGLKPAGGLDLFGGLISHDEQVAGYGHNRAFETILEKGLAALSPARQQDASITPPLAYGSLKSKLMAAIGDECHCEQVKLNGEERLRLAMWIDANAPYHDRFVNKRSEAPVYDLATDQTLLQGLTTIHVRRCAACHHPAEVTHLDWIDIGDARRSLFLASPLAEAAGGRGKCRPSAYRSAADADYRAALAIVEAAVEKTWSQPRRDVQALARPAPSARIAGE
jgi:hypothetical protein